METGFANWNEDAEDYEKDNYKDAMRHLQVDDMQCKGDLEHKDKAISNVVVGFVTWFDEAAVS